MKVYLLKLTLKPNIINTIKIKSFKTIIWISKRIIAQRKMENRNVGNSKIFHQKAREWNCMR